MSHHVRVFDLKPLSLGEGGADLLDELRAAGECGRNGVRQRAGSYNAPGKHAGVLLEDRRVGLRPWHTSWRDCRLSTFGLSLR